MMESLGTDIGRMKRGATGLLAAGTITAVVIRGALFLLSTGEFQPAFGSDQFGGGLASLSLDVLLAMILVGAAVAVSSLSDQRHAAVGAYVLGWIYIADCLIYGATTATFYLTSTETDAPAWFAVVPGVLQIPLIVLSALIIRRTAWAVTRRADGPSRAASRSGRSRPDPGGSHA
jgi:hypothetical protein